MVPPIGNLKIGEAISMTGHAFGKVSRVLSTERAVLIVPVIVMFTVILEDQGYLGHKQVQLYGDLGPGTIVHVNGGLREERFQRFH